MLNIATDAPASQLKTSCWPASSEVVLLADNVDQYREAEAIAPTGEAGRPVGSFA